MFPQIDAIINENDFKALVQPIAPPDPVGISQPERFQQLPRLNTRLFEELENAGVNAVDEVTMIPKYLNDLSTKVNVGLQGLFGRIGNRSEKVARKNLTSATINDKIRGLTEWLKDPINSIPTFLIFVLGGYLLFKRKG